MGGVSEIEKQQKILTDEVFAAELQRIFEEKNVRSVLLVCGGSFRRQKLYEKIRSLIEESGAALTEFSDFCPNPVYDSVVKGVRVFREHRCDFLIAAGGGSAMDVAKCIKLFSGMEDDRNYLEQEIPGEDKIPLLAVPTTAGTGSEATRFAVIYYEGNKQSVSHVNSIPDYVLFDASLLETLPLYHKKATMLDAFCHAAESSWSVNSTKESRAYSAEAIRLIYQYKDSYLKNEKEGNEQMLRAANIAGKAINITQTTAGHAMAYKLTSLYGLAHGHAAALCVAAVWPYMAAHPEKCMDARGSEHLRKVLEELSGACGCGSTEEAIQKFRDMLRELEMAVPIMKDEEELALLRSSVNPQRLKNNPAALDGETLGNLYRRIFEGL